MRILEMPMADLAELIKVQLEEGDRAPLNVRGSSMVPMLRDRRDQVWLTRLRRPLKKGDVILYQRESGQYVLHRAIRVDGTESCLCCGDNCLVTERVRQSGIVGVVEAFRRNGKAVSTHDWRYRIYVWIWLGLFPWRRPILKLRRKLGRIKRRRQLRNHA